MKNLILLPALALAACAAQTPAQTAATQNAAVAVGTAAGTYAPQTVGKIVAEGQLVCAYGPTIVAMVSAVTNAPILAKGASSQFVQTVCGAINGIPVTPPAAPIPTVAVVPPVA